VSRLSALRAIVRITHPFPSLARSVANPDASKRSLSVGVHGWSTGRILWHHKTVQRPVDRFLARLRRLPNFGGRGWKAICPLAYGDREHVLRIDVAADGKVLLFCHGGCSTEDVLKAIDLRKSDLFPVREVGRGRRGPAQSEAVRLARLGLNDAEIERALARARAPTGGK
jgi:hypothetical protein